jgi:hypothetical protein
MDLHELISQLTDPERNVRQKAAESLGQAPRIESVGALCKSLADNDRGVRSAVARALGRVLSEFVVPGLDLDDTTLLSLCDALCDFGNERYVRYVAAVGLGRTRDVRAIAALCSVLGDVDARVYTGAADSLVEIGVASILPLCSALGDVDASYQIRAEYTLGRICDNAGRLTDRILCSPTLSVGQIVDTIRALRLAPHGFGRRWGDVPANLSAYCVKLRRQKSVDAQLRRCAEAALAELARRANPDTLLRASDRGGCAESRELLRGNPIDARDGEADELLRAADEGVGGMS